jgi:hypothetical protein
MRHGGIPRSSVTAALRQRLQSDAGTTLIELMVGIVLLTIFMALFTGAIVMMNSAMNKTQAVNLTSSQLTVAFQNLDPTVRYASAISTPGKAERGTGSSGDWYVELRTTNTGTQVCTQLRVDIASQQLQRRTWDVVGAIASKPVAWVPISSGISNGRAAGGALSQPFYLVPPLGNSLFQQLTTNLTATSGTGSSQTTSTSSFTVPATNSSQPQPTAPICQEQGRP